MRIERELMRGAGPMAVMPPLSSGEKYGYELVEALDKQSNGVLATGQSTLYPLLYNLEVKGLIASRVDNETARPRRYYRLTGKGKKKLEHDTKQWQSLHEAMAAMGMSDRPVPKPIPFAVERRNSFHRFRCAIRASAECNFPRG